MEPLDPSFERRLRLARASRTCFLEHLLTEESGYLRLLAEASVRSDLRRWFERSGSVHEVLMRGRARFRWFRGSTREDWRAWLRGLLSETLTELEDARPSDPGAYGPAPTLEARLALAVDSFDQLKAWSEFWVEPRGDEPEPSIVAALERLGHRERESILLRNDLGASWEEIGEQLEVTPSRARELHGRAILRLTRMLGPEVG